MIHFSESRTSVNFAKPNLRRVSRSRLPGRRFKLPLASTGGGVNDGLALLNLTKAHGVLEKELIVRGRMKTANVHVAIPVYPVLEALVNRLCMRGRREDGGDSLRNGGLLLEKVDDIFLHGLRRLGRNDDLLRRRSVVSRAENGHTGSTTGGPEWEQDNGQKTKHSEYQ